MNEIEKHLSTPMGIHRVLREPYDDREVFESVYDLVKYCKTGARYNGQRVTLKTNTKVGALDIIANFTIMDDFPILELPSGQLITEDITIDDVTNKYVLVYYYNPIMAKQKMMLENYFVENNLTNYLTYSINNPFMYSLMEILDIFRIYFNEEDYLHYDYDFILKISDSSNTAMLHISQDYNPFNDPEQFTDLNTGNANIRTRIDNELIYLPNQTSNYSGLLETVYDDNTYYLFPQTNTIQEDSVAALYLQADEYLLRADALGVL